MPRGCPPGGAKSDGQNGPNQTIKLTLPRTILTNCLQPSANGPSDGSPTKNMPSPPIWILSNQRIDPSIGIEIPSLGISLILIRKGSVRASEPPLRPRQIPRSKVIQPRLGISFFAGRTKQACVRNGHNRILPITSGKWHPKQWQRLPILLRANEPQQSAKDPMQSEFGVQIAGSGGGSRQQPAD